MRCRLRLGLVLMSAQYQYLQVPENGCAEAGGSDGSEWKTLADRRAEIGDCCFD